MLPKWLAYVVTNQSEDHHVVTARLMAKLSAVASTTTDAHKQQAFATGTN